MKALAVVLCLMLAGCTVSVGLTNSPPTPDSCESLPPGRVCH